MKRIRVQKQSSGNELDFQGALKEAFKSLDCKENSRRLIYPLLTDAFANISSLSTANKLYACVVSAGLERHTSIFAPIVDVYSRYNSIRDALVSFQLTNCKGIASYNIILTACIKHGHHDEALSLFLELLQTHTVAPNKVTFIRALMAASHHKESLEYSLLLHTYIVEYEMHSDLFVGNSLISMYNRCRRLDDAERVFTGMPVRDVVSWTSMIDAYVCVNDSKKALQLFHSMKATGIRPNAVTFITLVKTFNNPGALAEAKEIHALIQSSGLELDPLLGNTLVSMYGKCGSLEEAHAMYKKLDENDVVSWNCILAAYAQQGSGKGALDLFNTGLKKGLRPNNVTFVTIFDACSSIKAVDEGQILHSFIQERNVLCDIVLQTALLNMYGKCGFVDDAKHHFHKMDAHNVVSWTAIISAFAQHGHARDALNTFYQLMNSAVRPNNVTFVAILDACTSPTLLAEGRLIHFAVVLGAFDMDNTVGHSLLKMYNICGQIDDALTLFDMLPFQDVIAWTAMIGAFGQYGHGDRALEFFAKMLQSPTLPNNITFVCVLDSCASLTALGEGKLAHAYMIELDLILDRDVGTALVNMYGKCGNVEDAYNIFVTLNDMDIITWNVMLAAYAQHGHGKLALQLYRSMEDNRVRPNSYTFISVLNACSHAGFVELGQQYLDCMKPKYGITPMSEHYACVVDLLGRAGRLEEAAKFICDIPLPPSAALWMSFLSACRLHNSYEWGAVAAENIRKLEPQNISAYVVLSNIYAALGRWDDLAKLDHVNVENRASI